MRRRARPDLSGDADDASFIAASMREPDRFATVFDRHAGPIHRYLARRLGAQAADDLLGETFLVAFRKRHDYDGTRGDARPWLYGIATHLVAQHRRDEVRAARLARAVPEDGAALCHAEQVAADVTAAALRDTLDAALALLAGGDRDVLLLVAQEELTYDEVAVALDIPVGTVRSRLHRARQTLRAVLGGTNPAMINEEAIHHG